MKVNEGKKIKSMTPNAKIARLPSHIRHHPIALPSRLSQCRNRPDQEAGWVSYGKLRKVMEGYGNFPGATARASNRPRRPFLIFPRGHVFLCAFN
jgi:hypothetical protein